MSKEVKIIGANPIVRLFDDGEVTAAVSVWIVDWSTKGKGNAMVAWHEGKVRVFGVDTKLSSWLAEDFTRHFPEFKDLPWGEPTVLPLPVVARVNLDSGMTVTAGDITVKTSKVLAQRQFTTDSFDLDGEKWGLTMVIVPQGEAEVRVGVVRVPGKPQLAGTPEQPSSSAFLTAAEVWTK